MTSVRNKAIVSDFINAVSESRVDDAFALLAPGFIWQTWGRLPFSGRNDKVTVRGFLHGLRDAFDRPPVWLIDRMIAEDETVAVECHTVGDTNGGFEYRNRYHLAADLHEGLIVELREYMDTQHCQDLVDALQGEAAAERGRMALGQGSAR